MPVKNKPLYNYFRTKCSFCYGKERPIDGLSIHDISMSISSNGNYIPFYEYNLLLYKVPENLVAEFLLNCSKPQKS